MMGTVSGSEGTSTSELNLFRCRLCLHHRPHNADASQDHLRILIHSLFAFWINPDDKFKIVCMECVNTVIGICSFYKNVQEVQEKICNNSIDVYSDNQIVDSDHQGWPENKKSLLISFDEANNDETNSKDANEECVDSYDEDIENNCKTVNSDSLKKECETSDEVDDKPDSSKSPSSPDITDHYESDSSLKSDINTNKEDDDLTPYTFPSEMFKYGKMILNRNELKIALRKFFNLNCNICKINEKFTELNDLFKHYKSEHQTKGYVMCCNSKIYNRRSIYMHMGRHLQPSAFECPICKRVVSRPGFLKLHIQTHLTDSEKLYICDQCDKGFSNLSALTTHKKIHVPIDQRDTFSCKICDKTFTLRACLLTHIYSVHNNLNYLCDICGKSFQTKSNHKMHMLIHNPPEENAKAACSKCGRIFKNKHSLQVHMKRHGALKQCTQCEFTTPLRDRMKRHIIVEHSNSKPYSCTMCDKRFKFKNGLNSHVVQHTGEHKYECEFCMRTFASSGNYYKHRKRMHADLIESNKM